ncbi:hypothetical protein CYMTET_54368 [Cymbomonas tetramitiformis]|uniref:Sugar phosphate transporter domain-containing protein n=1 Tax=Cymbomonas tetramitiformis TaxID=36881 RepID=A0AAE0ENS9_9CHLO|nr:hypothetical protein CYMTET_54368 [Cymbomonas tetramitiformis]
MTSLATAMAMCTLLFTGTVSSLLQQYISKQGVDPSAQVSLWMQYIAQAGFAHLILWRQFSQGVKPVSLTTKQRTLTWVMGGFHVSGFLAIIPAVNLIGIALWSIIYSSGLIVSAVFSRMILRKAPSTQQLVGITVTSLGLAHRGYTTMQDASAGNLEGDSSSLILGVLYSLLTTVCFSSVPIVVELINFRLPASKSVPSNQISAASSRVGLTVMTIYMLVYTFPNWNSLVTSPLQVNGVAVSEAALSYMANMALYVWHNTMYMEVTRLAGAVGNGLVNSVRSAVVVLAGVLLYCREDMPSLCLNEAKAISVTLVVLGGLIYTTGPPAMYVGAQNEGISKKKK